MTEEHFQELKRAQAIIDRLKAYRESLLTCPMGLEPSGRMRIRELSTPPRDDHDRAVLLLLDDYERLLALIAAPVSKREGVDAARDGSGSEQSERVATGGFNERS